MTLDRPLVRLRGHHGPDDDLTLHRPLRLVRLRGHHGPDDGLPSPRLLLSLEFLTRRGDDDRLGLLSLELLRRHDARRHSGDGGSP